MTVLASAVAIGDNQLLIDAPMTVGRIPGWVKIDTELLNVGGQHFRTGTTLVLTDPATATHSLGATVTYAGRPFDADFLAAGGGGGAIAVDNTVDPPVEVTTIIAPGAVNADFLATLPSGSLLTDPGALWEAEHEYVEDDRILIFDTSVFGADGSGTSGALEPDWFTDNSDGDISWSWLGELGQLNVQLMPQGLPVFAVTSPTAMLTSIVNDGTGSPADGAGVAAPLGRLYRVIEGETAAGMYLKVGLADTAWRSVFTFDATAFDPPPAAQVIPAAPTAQDIADVLVALRLATQAV